LKIGLNMPTLIRHIIIVSLVFPNEDNF